ncbi:MAG: hypothetical protein NXI20_01570 [bacterium]|nr:hypothetical protein [bacterium]
MKTKPQITGYIWYNPDTTMYQKGSLDDFNFFAESSEKKDEYSLIMKLNNASDILAYKLVKELNNARHNLVERVLRATA